MISLLDKQDFVGGNGGYLFDSGCNVTGLRKVYMEQVCMEHGKYKYDNCNKIHPYLIKRIFLEFNNSPTDFSLNTKHGRYPQYFDVYFSRNKSLHV